MRVAKTMSARIIKVLHELGSVGTLGAVSACLLLLGIHRDDVGAASNDILAMIRFVLMPSFVAVLLSGLLALVVTPAYMNAGWAWLKALLGISVFEASLALSSSSREVADLTVRGTAGGHEAAIQLAHAVRTETGVLWVLFAVSVLNVVFGVWRPRLMRPLKSS